MLELGPRYRAPGRQPPARSGLPQTTAARGTVAAIRRVADYEEWALAHCGLEYRRAVLRQWNRPSGQLPPQTLSTFDAASCSFDGTRIVLEECATLEGRAMVYHDIDARLSDTPVAGYAGQKLLAMRVSIFERKR